MKRNQKKGLSLLIISVLMLSLLSACAGKANEKTGGNEPVGGNEPAETTAANDKQEPAPEKPPEPVTLTLMAPWSKEQVAERIGDAVKEKYPHITVETTSKWTDKKDLEEMFAKNVVPDLLLTTDGFGVLQEMDLLYPLDEPLEGLNFDFSRISSGAQEAIRARDPEGQGRLIGVPIEDVFVALHYNKDIFDKFGVPYPKDGITWDEVLDLAKKLTGERDGVKYYGFASTTSMSQAMTQLSASGTDPETGEPQFSKNPAFEKFYSLVKSFADIPGNWEKGIAYDFSKKDVAMSLGLTSNTIPFFPEDLNYDVVSFPTWSDLPGVGPSNLPLSLAVNKQSKHIEEALKVLDLLMNDDQLTRLSRIGVSVSSSNQDILQQFAADRMKSPKNIKGMYSLTPAKPAPYSKFGPDILLYGTNFVGSQVTPFLESGDDVKTFLRKMDETYAATVKEIQSKK
ncbi:ABC transporter substrate-binding protein [Paenibacillus spongiae]|uniref:Extracellular solute-binding protein n=1 Tax=Paenibacillus spongiae TaxID=2909671 RepID=A0ABY5S8Y2_9BACL|nr:extracellular solute-binding protein [Paenibacillus spongiae]UVI30184.1 extracellular solute-binding protein [Paenibacillus spongiae]